MKTYSFAISGMTCHACEALIRMDLEDAGLPAPVSIDQSTGSMEIQAEETDLDRVKEVIEQGGKYHVTSIGEHRV